ncbi:hypothetical protein SAMN06265367_1035 [Algoriphagus winogradskyi]|uniref:Transposase n=1 Tax=Algoriphagus winogradskyi TaxID=237017 RepID=A0ABY1NVM1_9BACT|nr:hypothetical protein SAMN06265367_1035 [Algoriphagus winogradskyi]
MLRSIYVKNKKATTKFFLGKNANWRDLDEKFNGYAKWLTIN